jgi:hypothetical protein
MNFASTLEVDTVKLNHISDYFLEKYGLNIRSISKINHSFERTLSISLFGSEKEVDSISDTLNSEDDW